ncbi:MAG: hypothetical protein WC197_06130 [Candidatus Gastranaerophilaceae bacterium]|jgi:hypothetical protein
MSLYGENSYHSSLNEDISNETYLDLWSDVFEYAKNLNGNWLVSQEIFRKKLVPIAEKDPLKFAKLINDMVKISGVRIKSRQLYARSLRFIRRFKSLKNVSTLELSKALTDMLNAGISDPSFSQRALRKVKV